MPGSAVIVSGSMALDDVDPSVALSIGDLGLWLKKMIVCDCVFLCLVCFLLLRGETHIPTLSSPFFVCMCDGEEVACSQPCLGCLPVLAVVLPSLHGKKK
eukprot:RCo054765